MKQNSQAFTLIELLVVIAIVAILAAILFPVFAQAKLAAKKASDLSQLKQLGLGVNIYLNDYDDTYPLQSVGIYGNQWNLAPRWSGKEVIGPYIKNTTIFESTGDPSTLAGMEWMYTSGLAQLCPAIYGANQANVAVNSYFDNALALNPYGWDDWAFNPSETPPVEQAGLFGVGPAFDGSFEFIVYFTGSFVTTASQVQYPSELIMLSDGATDTNQWLSTFSPEEFQCANATNTEINFCDGDLDTVSRVVGVLEASTTPFGFTFGHPGPWNTTNTMREYNGAANYLMTDSSAKSYRPGQLMEGGLYLSQHKSAAKRAGGDWSKLTSDEQKLFLDRARGNQNSAQALFYTVSGRMAETAARRHMPPKG